MWLESIIDVRENNKMRFDLKLELHLAIYIQTLLKDYITFELDDSDTSQEIIIKKEGEVINTEQLFYWWQIIRFEEILDEEKTIFNEFNELKTKLTSVIKKVKNPTINDKDTPEETVKKNTKIEANNAKIQKLNNHLKESAESSNININSLKFFRTTYTNFKSIEGFLNNIRIILMNR